MDEGKFAADFITRNLEYILEVGGKAFGKLDESLKRKLKTAYNNYLRNIDDKYAYSKSFFIRDEKVDLYNYYIPTSISNHGNIIDTPDIKQCLSRSKNIVISGTGGCGKSVLMRHLVLDCIKQQQYVPILIELRDLNGETAGIEKLIFSTLEAFGFNLSENFIKATMADGHLAFFFDGFDEVEHKLRKKLIKYIKTLIRKYNNCPIIITSRPEDVFQGIDEFIIYNVSPLSKQKAISLINKLPYGIAIKNKFCNELNKKLYDQHQSFLSNPLLLSIMLLTYGENADIPSKTSLFYNQAYEALFQRHDARKEGYARERLTKLDIQDFSKVFSLFSLQTYDNRLFKISQVDCLNFIGKSKGKLQFEFNNNDYLKDLLSSVCLLVEDGLEIAFSHRSFQEYFVALYISTASFDTQKKLIERYWKNITFDNVITLLYEMNPSLVEKLLFIPKLEELFNNIGVKRIVGITHYTKYLQFIYTNIVISTDRNSMLSATFHDDGLSWIKLMRMATSELDQLNEMKADKSHEFALFMRNKYCTDKKSIMFLTKNLTYKSNIAKDLASSDSWISISELDKSYQIYKALLKKHNNEIKELDDLLDL